MLSQATASSSRPPSSACSASTEWGGAGASMSAMGAASPRALALPATAISRRRELLFRDDRHLHGHVHVGVQVQGDSVLAHHAQRSVRQAHFAALDIEAGTRQVLGDVAGTDRAEQLPFRTRLGVNGELEILHRSRPLLGRGQVLARLVLELGAPRLEARDVLRRGERRLALRQEEIAAETRAHLDAIADVAEVGDLLQQNDFHRCKPLVLVGVGQERQETRALDRDRELPLVEGLGARDAARHDLARLGDVALEYRQILVVDRLHPFGGEATELLATREAAAAATGSSGHCHESFPRIEFSAVRPGALAPQAPSPTVSSSSLGTVPSSRARSRRLPPPSPSSSAALAIGEGSVTAASMFTTRWRSTASLKRKAPVSSSRVFLSVSMFIST